MRTIHALMHHEFNLNRGAASWINGHRTDDWDRRSTPLYDLNLGKFQNA